MYVGEHIALSIEKEIEIKKKKWEDCIHAYGGFTFALDLNTSPVQIPVDNHSLHLYLAFSPSFTSIYNHHSDGGERWSTA